MTKGQRYGIMSIAKSKGDHLIMNEELQKAAVPEKIQKKDLRIQEDRQDERRSHLVVKDNLLIQKSKFHLTATEQKLVCYVISLIKPTDKALDKYTININDFAKLCGISPKNVYKEFRKMIDDLDNKAVWLTMGDKTFKFRWFSEAEYIEKQGKVILMLNSNMKQYLIDLSHSFTQYELYNILALKSKYSIRLYELFKSYSYKQTKDFDLEDLKELLGADNYKVYSDFKKRVLEKAIQEINTYSDLNVEYYAMAEGGNHKINRIWFTITRKESFEGYIAYQKTIDEINRKNKQVIGQISMFDKTEKEFVEGYDEE